MVRRDRLFGSRRGMFIEEQGYEKDFVGYTILAILKGGNLLPSRPRRIIPQKRRMGENMTLQSMSRHQKGKGLTTNRSSHKLLVMRNKKQGSSVTDLVEEVMQDLRRIFKVVETYSRSVETRFGITGPQLWALWELGRSAPLSLKNLAARMHLSPSTVVGVVDRLIAKDLVVREGDPVDRRRVCLSLSDKGKALTRQAPNPAQDQLIKGLKSLDSQQLETLSQSLGTLVLTMDADKIQAPFFFSEE